MTAYVKTTNGTFPNSNFYLAWEAFNTMGYGVKLFEESELDEGKLQLSQQTPLFAGTTVFRKAMQKMNINYDSFDCYPASLSKYYGRTIRVSTLGKVKNEFERTGKQVFVKPIRTKDFTGVVLKSFLELIPLAKRADDIPVFVCEPVEMITEYRVYVHDKDILGVKHYYGKWNVVPDEKIIENAVKDYADSPIAYGLDFAVTNEGKTILVESNDACNLGNYGLDAIYYGEMIVARWFELTKTK